MSKIKYYINFEETKVYDVSPMHEDDPVRLYIEQNYEPISEEIIAQKKEELIEEGEYEFDEYKYNLMDYPCYEDCLYFPSLQKKEELLLEDEIIDLSFDGNKDEYNLIVEEMKNGGVYDSYI